MVKFLLVAGLVFAAVIGILALIVYSLWAWSFVILWFAKGTLATYFGWAGALTTQAVQASLIGISTIYSLYFSRIASKVEDINTGVKDDKEVNFITLVITALILPWFIMAILYFQIWWFAL
jgi:hypothetical protein